jgi:hypothetical protein
MVIGKISFAQSLAKSSASPDVTRNAKIITVHQRRLDHEFYDSLNDQKFWNGRHFNRWVSLGLGQPAAVGNIKLVIQ